MENMGWGWEWGNGPLDMHVSLTSAILTLNSQRAGLIHLSTYSSSVFYFSKVPSRELAIRKYPRKTGGLAAATQSVTVLPRIVTKLGHLHSELFSPSKAPSPL